MDKKVLKSAIVKDRDGLWLTLWYDPQTKHSYPIKNKKDLINIVKAITSFFIYDKEE